MAVGVDADGHFVAFHADHYDDSGAHPIGGGSAGMLACPLISGPYRRPARLARDTALHEHVWQGRVPRPVDDGDDRASSSSTWWRARSEWTRSSCAAAM